MLTLLATLLTALATTLLTTLAALLTALTTLAALLATLLTALTTTLAALLATLTAALRSTLIALILVLHWMLLSKFEASPTRECPPGSSHQRFLRVAHNKGSAAPSLTGWRNDRTSLWRAQPSNVAAISASDRGVRGAAWRS
ncbi:hypothetical protein LAC81_34715 (plasmid) [Ensifer adhaerens]|nr:hypothetical protein [Ensifer adhaerens]UAY05536.1 hypothetical protein LAC80_34720 [Ensifer adhaerens]UAY12914.1 hypothetical protein LAC81_34715 [Ensifer adhaerens]